MTYNIKRGDILASGNTSDVIIAMSSSLTGKMCLELPYQVDYSKLHQPIALGDVLSLSFPSEGEKSEESARQVHMLICHTLVEPGWAEADRYVRMGLDFLWRTQRPDQTFSIVEIGTGKEGGLLYGADTQAILKAMGDSYLEMDLYAYDEVMDRLEMLVLRRSQIPPLKPSQVWSVRYGISYF